MMFKKMNVKQFSSLFFPSLLFFFFSASSGFAQKTGGSPFKPEISSESFLSTVQQKAPWIEIDEQAILVNNRRDLVEVPGRPAGWNQHLTAQSRPSDLTWSGVTPVIYGKDYRLNWEKLQAEFPATDRLESRAKWFETFPFNPAEATFKYPYPILSYWDILPHPPIEKLEDDLQSYSEVYGNEGTDSPLLHAPAQLEIDAITDSELSAGNEVNLLSNGEVFQALLRNLEATQKDILASNMFISCDPSNAPLLDLLEKKVNSGVRIHIIFDRIFALKYSKCFKRLKKMGINVNYSNEFFKLKNSMVYHNKFWIFDGKSAVVYGPNIIDTQFNSNGFNGLFRDSGIAIKGPLVNDLIVGYGQILKHLKSKAFKEISDRVMTAQANILADRHLGLRSTQTLTKKGTAPLPEGSCRVVFQGSHNDRKNVTDLYENLIRNSEKNLFISHLQLDGESEKSPQMMRLHSAIQNRLKNPQYRVDIEGNNWRTATDVPSSTYDPKELLSKLYQLFTKTADLRTVATEIRARLNHSMPPNFHYWNYFQYYHQKTMLLDNVISVVGSFNANRVSTDKSFEMSVVCYDQKLNHQMRHSIILDLLNSIPLVSGKAK
jgi:phosphatidylserine/phosphatidylglycerophosphate/cardiolipin synthase-like enzyme